MSRPIGGLACRIRPLAHHSSHWRRCARSAFDLGAPNARTERHQVKHPARARSAHLCSGSSTQIAGSVLSLIAGCGVVLCGCGTGTARPERAICAEERVGTLLHPPTPDVPLGIQRCRREVRLLLVLPRGLGGSPPGPGVSLISHECEQHSKSDHTTRRECCGWRVKRRGHAEAYLRAKQNGCDDSDHAGDGAESLCVAAAEPLDVQKPMF